MKIIICDIDGTLADSDHRQQYLKQTPKDWESFYRPDLIIRDKLIEPTAYLLRKIETDVKNSRMDLYFLTGRMEKHRVITRTWLEQHGLTFYQDLIMRENEDYRQDIEFKKSVIDQWFNRSDILFILEDRDQCVRGFRDIGLTCWQVRDGAY